MQALSTSTALADASTQHIDYLLRYSLLLYFFKITFGIILFRVWGNNNEICLSVIIS